MMNKQKTALVVEGGGNRGVFSFGITDSFIKNNFDPFDIYIGVSNGAAVLCWYLIKESENNLEKMIYSATGNYINYKNLFLNKDIIKFHKLYKDGERMFQPNMEKIAQNTIGKKYISVVTDAETADAEYYAFDESNSKDKESWMEIMIASGTLPFLVKTPSLINGRRKFDGGIADPIPVKKAYEMGAKKIVVIRTYEKEFKRKIKIENYIGAFFTRNYKNLNRALLEHDKTYNESLNFINNPPNDCQIIQLCPPKRLKTKRDSKNVIVMKADYNLGLKIGEKFLNSSFF